MKKKIVIFGGCFNPPLNSHFSLAEQIVNSDPLIEKILFVPVNDCYPKKDLIEGTHRYHMLKMVCDKNQKFEVSRLEIDCHKPLYTVDTLTKFQTSYPDYEIYFTMGTDNLKHLETWKKADLLVKNFKFFIFEREQDNMEDLIQDSKFLKENKHAFIKVDDLIKSNLSSSFVREKIRNRKSIRYITPDEIVNYIQNNHLYQNG